MKAIGISPGLSSSCSIPTMSSQSYSKLCRGRNPTELTHGYRKWPATLAVASTGETVRVGAEETLLSALNRSGVHASYSCQQGFCGTCRTRVLDGTVDHRDTLLTDPERDNGLMLICISRAADGSHLTLDL